MVVGIYLNARRFSKAEREQRPDNRAAGAGHPSALLGPYRIKSFPVSSSASLALAASVSLRSPGAVR